VKSAGFAAGIRVLMAANSVANESPLIEKQAAKSSTH
jgi:hypothetical protein